ncbi:MAG: hypothetical protein L0G99_16835 [Propionibacteriales bacterium]|nr:hypothetical protein [Propionibacteriales bacterium]
MPTGLRIAGFLAALAIIFGGGWLLGRAVPGESNVPPGMPASSPQRMEHQGGTTGSANPTPQEHKETRDGDGDG